MYVRHGGSLIRSAVHSTPIAVYFFKYRAMGNDIERSEMIDCLCG